MKAVSFVGNSLEVVRSFPESARRDVGFQIDRVQRGLDPIDWKPMRAVGVGVREIRVRQAEGGYRVIYTATFKDVVYVLHAFEKRTRATPKRDIELASTRFKDLLRRVGR